LLSNEVMAGDIKIAKSTMQTEKVAADLVKKIERHKNKKAVVLAMAGDLGSGKTTFTQFFAKALGIKEKITSPTFVILRKFQIPNSKSQTNSKFKFQNFKTLAHIDAYRIENPKEILDLGWEEMVNNPENIILVEWADKIKKILPKDCVWVKFKHKNETTREIKVDLSR